MRWFRLHNDLLNDPIVQGLPAEQYKIYINLLCHASILNKGGNVGTIKQVAFALRETIESVSSCFIAFHRVNLLVKCGTENETFHLPQWKKKQYKSDTSTQRVKKHRESLKRSETVTVTPPDTDTDTDTDIKPPPEKVKKFDPQDLEFAHAMLESIRQQQPDFKEPNLKSWAATVRLMRERDSRTLGEMSRVWQWARFDSFWASNILSASKFREKYDTLSLKMKSDREKGANLKPQRFDGNSNTNVAGTPTDTRQRTIQEDLTDRDWAK